MKFQQHPNTYVSSVTLLTGSLQRAVEFYTSIIGLAILQKTDESATFTADGSHPILTVKLQKYILPKEPRRTGLYHFAILLPSRKELSAFLHHLLGSGYPIQGASDHLVSEAIYFADPDGNGIEVYADRSDEKWNWTNGQVEMATDPLQAENLLAESSADDWRGIPAGTVMGHIHLHVSDLAQAETFYTEGLGFEVVTKYGNQALFLSTGGYHHHIGLNTWNGTSAPAPSENSVRMASYSIVYPSGEERRKAAERLEKLGTETIFKDGALITADPSGNWIHLLV
ncbi:VOC family protein [Bacillus sp. FJAT-42376]|uniref:VOC family protein n=1 Tax=Bacillus sp. FJAT-42376 TaxID=2014076 RepID=UPI000F4EF5AA|nr:VOC family protein [Bacillus sp. FJAT-42376]AZB41621.1 VOC family protein [Bacillus sp. FJAT-42376]